MARLRQRLSRLAFQTLCHGGSRLGRLDPRAQPRRYGVEHMVDVRYAGGREREHVLDVWRPQKAAGPLPIVLYVHGGGFSMLSKETHWPMALAFARRGYLVFNVEYRLAPKHPFPAGLEDVCRAYAWIVANARRYGGDPNQIVLAGESAGANLVTSLTLALTYERKEPFARAAFDLGTVPRAVVPACGVFQVSDLLRLKRDKPHISNFVLDLLYEVEGAYLGNGPWPLGTDLADPVVVLERGDKPARPLPPFFVPVGTRDPLLRDTRRLVAALTALGADATAKYYEGEIHAFHAMPMLENARRCWRDTFAFLDRHVPVSAA